MNFNRRRKDPEQLIAIFQTCFLLKWFGEEIRVCEWITGSAAFPSGFVSFTGYA